VGALWSGRRDTPPGTLVRNAVITIVVWVVLSAIALRPLRDLTIATPLPVRALIVAAWLLPGGLALGAPLPTAVRALRRETPALVPWAWGANACASVLASIAVVLISMQIGFRGTLLLCAAIYVLGYLALRRTLPARVSCVTGCERLQAGTSEV
jgi:hypothetical protein